MGNVTSTLTMRLVDGVSAGARKVRQSLDSLDAAAKRTKARAGHAGAAGYLAGGGMAMAAGAVGAYAGANTLKDAVTKSASLDRRLTYIRQTAGATEKEAANLKKNLYGIANTTAAPIEKVIDGLDSLVAAGRSLPDAMSFLPSVVRTAQASGAEILDIAKSADAFGQSFGIAAGDMEKAFDAAVKLGKEGKFELKDMARYLPSLLPSAATRGIKGLEGLNQIMAALQAARINSGTAEEAATAVGDLLQKMDSDETIKKFAKNFKINLPEAMKAAKAAGKNSLDAFLDITEKAIKGNDELINKIAADKEFRRGLTALIQHRREYERLRATARNSTGEVGRDLKVVTGDAQASIDRLANSWDQFLVALGRTLDKVGVSSNLEGLARELGQIADILDAIDKKDYVRAGKGVAQFLDGRTPEQRAADREKARQDGLRASMRAAQGQVDENTKILDSGEIDDIRKKIAEIEGGSMGSGSRRDSTLKILREHLAAAEEDQAAARERILAERKKENDAFVGLLPPLPQGPSGLPFDLVRGKMPAAKDRVSGATRPRPRANLGTGTGDGAGSVPLGVMLDDASATAAAEQARAKVQAILNANPVTIPVRAGDVSGALGRAVSSGVQGAHSDTGTRRGPN